MIFAAHGLGTSWGADFGGLGAASPVRSIQATLRQMGIPVRVSGVIDADTVDAVNGIFSDWIDAPPRLRAGLSARNITRNAGLVNKYLRLAARGSMNIEAG